MKLLRLFTIFLISIFFTNCSIAQSDYRNFSDIFQSYYLVKDTDLLEKTLDFVNNTTMKHERLDPILIGFFGALFPKDTIVKNTFLSNLSKFKEADTKQLFLTLASLNIDSLYQKTEISPGFLDMNWASYFATGDTKFLDNIISIAPSSENRINLGLFLSGETAKWSLCSNAKQYSEVKKYLNSIKASNKFVDEILQNDPEKYKEEINTILKEQKQKGIWN